MTSLIARQDLMDNVERGFNRVSEFHPDTVSRMVEMGHIEVVGNVIEITPEGQAWIER